MPGPIYLSAEELAVVLGTLGKSDEARGLMRVTFGDLSVDEERGRLIAASHSLVARELLVVIDQPPQIQPALGEVLEVFLQHTSAVRAGRTGTFGEDVLTYYHSGERHLEHRLINGVAHRFQFRYQLAEIETCLGEFFAPQCAADPVLEPVNLPLGLLTDLGADMRHSFETVRDYLDRSVPAQPALSDFARDFATARWRGSSLFMQVTNRETLVLQGALWVQGTKRLWQIHGQTEVGDGGFQAHSCTAHEFNEFIRTLVEAGASER